MGTEIKKKQSRFCHALNLHYLHIKGIKFLLANFMIEVKSFLIRNRIQNSNKNEYPEIKQT